MFKTKKDLPVPASDEVRYTSGDVARIAGVSLRQLQWWDERGVVSPRQEGHRRVYLNQEVVEVSVIAELRRKGFSAELMHQIGHAFKLLLTSRLNTTQAIERIKTELGEVPEIAYMIDFILSSERGVIK